MKPIKPKRPISMKREAGKVEKEKETRLEAVKSKTIGRAKKVAGNIKKQVGSKLFGRKMDAADKNK